MLCYIKDMKTFKTLSKFDTTDYSLAEGENGQVTIYQKNAIELTTKYVGMWLIINKELYYISNATPNDDSIDLIIKSPIYAFYRQVEYDSTKNTYGSLIEDIINTNYGINCPDPEFALNYISVNNHDTTPCVIETDDYGYIIPYEIFDDALYKGVAINFNFTNDSLAIDVHLANYETASIVFNDGSTTLESESYDANYISKVTIIHDLGMDEETQEEQYETIDFYLSEDGHVSTTPPVNRAKGIWKYYNASQDEAPMMVAIGAFSHNNDNHKIEFRCLRRFSLYQPIKMRLRDGIFSTIITSRVFNSGDDRYYYKCGNLATTLTEKIGSGTEENAEEIKKIKNRISNMSGGGGGGGGGAVESVNGRTGHITLYKSDVGLENVDDVRQYSASNPPPTPTKSAIGLGNVDNVRQYSADNPPPYPVTSVNGRTGDVVVQGGSGGGVVIQPDPPTGDELLWIDTDDPGEVHILPEIDDDNVSEYDTWSSAKIRDFIYPVGSIYMSVNNVSPAVIFGGTWEQIEDRFLLASGTTYTAGDTGGEAEHTLVRAELPAEQYRIGQDMSALGVAETWYLTYANKAIDSMQTGAAIQRSATGAWAYTEPIGSGQAHNNMPPYLAVYIWKRMA